MVKLTLSFAGKTLTKVVPDKTPEVIEGTHELAVNMYDTRDERFTEEVRELISYNAITVNEEYGYQEQVVEYLDGLVKVESL